MKKKIKKTLFSSQIFRKMLETDTWNFVLVFVVILMIEKKRDWS